MWACPPGTVLGAADFGDASARALALGAMIASAYGATLRALHAERFEPPPYFTIDQIARLEAERRTSQAAAVPVLVARADMGPARGVFDRIALVGGPAGAAHDYAARLAETFGSVITDAGTLTACGDASLREASLVIVGTGDTTSMTAVSAAGLLSACRRPILFVPDRKEETRRTV